MKKLNNVKNGDSGSGIFYCIQCSLGQTKTGSLYYSLTLRDNTGMMKAKVWDADSLGWDIKAPCYFQADFTVSEYNDELQMTLGGLSPVSAENVDQSEFFPKSKKDTGEMYALLLKYLGKVEDPDFRALIDKVVSDSVLTKEMQEHAGDVKIHHAFVGGWLQHTLSVVKLCCAYAKYYPELNRDLLLPAAFLHDIGKLVELSPFPENQFTMEGQLFGHVVLDTYVVDAILGELPSFPKEKKDHLFHCLLAHHGKLEFGSPRVPATLEALALNLADNTDASLEIMLEALDKEPDAEITQQYSQFLGTRVVRTPSWQCAGHCTGGE